MTKTTTATGPSEHFIQGARDLDCDEDKARGDERLRKVAGQKPMEKGK